MYPMWWKTVRKTNVLLGLVVSILLVAILSASGSANEPYPQTVARIRLIISDQLDSGVASAASVAIAEGNSIIYAEGFGKRDWVQDLPTDVHTQFNFGSVTKVLTAASLLMLCDEGKLDLDEPVVAYLPEFTLKDERYKQITARMLLNHTSGLPGGNYRDGFAIEPNREYVQETLEVLRDNTLKHAPGAISVYCNDGFTVAEALVEKLSGLTFADFLKKNIFDPLGMKDSGFYLSGSNVAHLYNIEGSVLYPLERVSVLGSGGLSSTPSDLVRFGQAIYERKLLSVDSLHEFTISQVGPKTVPKGRVIYDFGLGWDDVAVESFADQGVQVLSKTGGTLMYNSQLLVVPEYEVVVAVTFAGLVDTDTVITSIMQTLLEEKGVLAPIAETSRLAQSAVIPREFGSYQGYYGTTASIVKIEFDWEANALNYWVFDGTGFVLEEVLSYQDDGAFLKGTQFRLRFMEHDDYQVITAQSGNQDGTLVFGQRIVPLANPIDGQAFANKVWVPRNYSAIDLTLSLTANP